jgi:hypothetical protein
LFQFTVVSPFEACFKHVFSDPPVELLWIYHVAGEGVLSFRHIVFFIVTMDQIQCHIPKLQPKKEALFMKLSLLKHPKRLLSDLTALAVLLSTLAPTASVYAGQLEPAKEINDKHASEPLPAGVDAEEMEEVASNSTPEVTPVAPKALQSIL